MPLPAALLARLKNRGIVQQEGEEVGHHLTIYDLLQSGIIYITSITNVVSLRPIDIIKLLVNHMGQI